MTGEGRKRKKMGRGVVKDQVPWWRNSGSQEWGRYTGPGQDVTTDSGEDWGWGVETGRGRRGEIKRGEEAKKQIIPGRAGGVWVRSGVRWASDRDPRGGAGRDAGRGFRLGLGWDLFLVNRRGD